MASERKRRLIQQFHMLHGNMDLKGKNSVLDANVESNDLSSGPVKGFLVRGSATQDSEDEKGQ